MTSLLRKRHRQIWTVTGLIIPVLFLLAIFNVPDFPYNDLPLSQRPVEYESVTFRKNTDIYDLELGKMEDGSQGITVMLKKAFNSPAVGFYASDSGDMHGAKFLFAVEGPNVYTAQLTHGTPGNIVVYDRVHKKMLESINITQ
ncbi:MAG: hypothetical protein MI975_04100 [Cytophagales bacterium]|nr:hypothetical protein [Cytophagales bacterium]